jgi:hypothetical protein
MPRNRDGKMARDALHTSLGEKSPAALFSDIAAFAAAKSAVFAACHSA